MRILFSVPIFLVASAACAQVQVGIFAGPQATGVRYLINENKQESGLKFGLNAGMQLKVPFENRLSFAPSVMYNLRGFKVKFSAPSFPPDSFAIDNSISFHTIELAFLLQHDFTTDAGHWFFRIGPSLDFALFGKEKYTTGNGGGTVKRNLKFSFGDYGHYLASAIFQLGYESPGGFFIYGHYNYGLTTMNNFDSGPLIGNRAAGITVGTYLKRNKL
jgi:hypothetical protein